MARLEPRSRHLFDVELDGLVVAHFKNVRGLTLEREVVEHQEGGRNDHMVKLPGQGQVGQITLERGWTGHAAFWQWMRECRELSGTGLSIRKSVDIILLSANAKTEVGRYTLRRCWPLKMDFEEFSSEPATALEKLELAHEGITFTQGGVQDDTPLAFTQGTQRRRAADRVDAARRTAAQRGGALVPLEPGAPAEDEPQSRWGAVAEKLARKALEKAADKVIETVVDRALRKVMGGGGSSGSALSPKALVHQALVKGSSMAVKEAAAALFAGMSGGAPPGPEGSSGAPGAAGSSAAGSSAGGRSAVPGGPPSAGGSAPAPEDDPFSWSGALALAKDFARRVKRVVDSDEPSWSDGVAAVQPPGGFGGPCLPG
jgi:phage tail-like protein